MKTMNEEMMTRNFLKFCYTCEDAHMCTNEEICKACWADKGLDNMEFETDGAEETRQLLFDYYA